MNKRERGPALQVADNIDDIIAQYEPPHTAELVNLRVRVHSRLDEMLKASADKKGRSFNSELCYRLAVSLKEHP